MLKSLTIQNYAIIRDLQIEFSGGLTIITGETGAGKSILLGALSLLVGQRADTSVLFDISRKCYVEGLFIVKGYGFEELFQQYELDFTDEVIIRREIGIDGKSRAFINDTPVNVSVLKEFGERLIDIHSQHQNIYLDTPAFQLKILDTFAKQSDLLSKYRETYLSFKQLVSQFEKLKEDYLKNKADSDYYQFQYNQLAEAKLVEGEQEQLEEELKTLTHAEEIKAQLGLAANNLSGEENSAIILLKDALHSLNKLKPFFKPSEELYKRLDTGLLELKDIASEISVEFDRIDFNPERAEFVKQRIDLLFSLLQKHRASSVLELINIKNELKGKLGEIENADFRLDELKVTIDKVRSNLDNIASVITKNRIGVIAPIENKIQELLKQLGMPNGLFKIELSAAPEYSNSGLDKVRFLFSANKQSAPQELSKVASGGEMARLMLSIKAVVAEQVTLPTVIFDEIDQGVSGDIADKMGNVIVNMSKCAQIINITHLPQIASKGSNHFLVYKKEVANSTHTQIKELQSDDRIIEIARMLSGEKLSEAAINNAKALLGIN